MDNKVKITVYDRAGNNASKELSVSTNPEAKTIAKTDSVSFNTLKNIGRWILLILLALLAILALILLGKKAAVWLMVLAKHSRRTGLKSAALSAVEMLEEAKRSRQLTHEEEKILTNLQKALAE